MAQKRTQRITSAREILRRRIFQSGPDRVGSLEQTRREMALGMKIRRLREDAGMTQKQLADQIGTQPSAISRIEDADYDSHSVSLLQKLAEALDMRLIIDFEPKSSKRSKTKAR